MEQVINNLLGIFAEGNVAVINLLGEEQRQRRWAVDPARPLQNGLFENEVLVWLATGRNEKMKERFGCSCASFLYIGDLFTYVKIPSGISIQKAVAIYLYRTVDGVSIYVLEDIFKVPAKTISMVFNSINTYIYNVLRPIWIVLPNEDEMEDSAKLFYGLRRLPNVIGAVDGTHIPILSDEIADINRKGVSSVNCMAMVDAHMIVRHTTSGAPGSISDITVYDRSSLFTWAQKLRQHGQRILNGQRVHYCIIGDAIYMSNDTVICPYSAEQLVGRADRQAYNYAQSSTRQRVEQAFGGIKNKFKILKMAQRYGLTAAENARITGYVFESCCVLWNILIYLGDVHFEYDYCDDEMPIILDPVNLDINKEIVVVGMLWCSTIIWCI